LVQQKIQNEKITTTLKDRKNKKIIQKKNYQITNVQNITEDVQKILEKEVITSEEKKAKSKIINIIQNAYEGRLVDKKEFLRVKLPHDKYLTFHFLDVNSTEFENSIHYDYDFFVVHNNTVIPLDTITLSKILNELEQLSKIEIDFYKPSGDINKTILVPTTEEEMSEKQKKMVRILKEIQDEDVCVSIIFGGFKRYTVIPGKTILNFKEQNKIKIQTLMVIEFYIKGIKQKQRFEFMKSKQ
jgi:hypothetical protein